MNLRNTFITALRALSKNKMRSALTSIGIIIGVSSVIIMVGIGNSASIAVKDKISTFGSNAMSVYDSKAKPLNIRDLENLKRIFQIKYITPVISETYTHVKYQNKNMYSRFFGVNNDFFKIKEWPLQVGGRYFTDLEIMSTDKVVVIGDTVRRELFGNSDPIGEVVIIKNIPFKVIGCLTEVGSSFSGRDFDNLLVIPYSTAIVKITNQKYFEEFYIATHNESMIDETVDIVRAYFRRVHSIPADLPDDFKVKTSKEKLKIAEDISNTLAILLAGIASISLFVGGVGIMNIMLVSVSERTREIGIRLAIGAKKKDVLVQFLIESVTLSSVGGIIGILFGITVTFLIVHFVQWPFILSVFSIIISFLFSAAVGIFFGYYPARKASNLKPIDALRYE